MDEQGVTVLADYSHKQELAGCSVRVALQLLHETSLCTSGCTDEVKSSTSVPCNPDFPLYFFHLVRILLQALDIICG